MKTKRIVKIIFFFIGMVLLLGNNGLPMITSAAETYSTYLPIVHNDNGNTNIPETTKVLSDETMQHLVSVSGDGKNFSFSKMTDEIKEVQPGDVIVSSVNDITPYGFLRKVNNVTSSGGEVVITTETATLEDAIQDGQIQISRILSPQDLQSQVLSDGVTLAMSTQALNDEFFFEIDDVILYDDDGNQIVADGIVTIEPNFDFDMTIENWNLEQLNFTINVTEKSELEIKAQVELLSVTKEIEIGRLYFSPIVIFVGPIPVVFTPVLTLNVGVDGNVHVGVTTGIVQETSLTAGVVYEHSSWHPISEHTKSFQAKPPRLSAGLELKGYIGARVALMLYGMIGPYADVNLFLELEADIYDTPWWELYGGLEVPIGIDIEIFSHNIANYKVSTIGIRKLLLQASINTNNKFVNGFSISSIDSESVNLKVCADNLAGKTVYLQMWRDAAQGYPANTWNLQSAANSNGIDINDIDGVGGTFANVDYYLVAAIEPIGSGEAAQRRTSCYDSTNQTRLCDNKHR